MSFAKTSQNPEGKLLRFLDLADSVRALVSQITSEGSKRLQAEAQELALRVNDKNLLFARSHRDPTNHLRDLVPASV